MGGATDTWVRAVIAVALVAALVPVAPVANASPEDVTVTDPSGDVMLARPNSGAAVPESQGFDIVEAKLFDESGEGFQIQIRVEDMSAAADQAGSSAVFVGACFKWNDQPFGVSIKYLLNPAPSFTARRIGTLNGACEPTAELQWGQWKDGVAAAVSAQQNTVTILVKRAMLGEIAKTSPPAQGDTIKELQAFVSDARRTRFDTAPDTGVAEGALTFTTNTANLDLRAGVDKNIAAALRCAGQPDMPTYAIEAGGKRGVPVTIMNPATSTRTVNFEVKTIAGDDWKPAMLPKIEVPAAEGTGTGNVTVNVILDTPAATKHKQCATLRVRGVDPGEANMLAEANFNVIAVSPPGPLHKKLYGHAASGATACGNDFDGIWLNTLESDPDDAESEVVMLECRDPSPVSSAALDLHVQLDVNPSHDLVVNTSAVGAKAIAMIGLRSDGAPTTADIDVTLTAGRLALQSLGHGRTRATITSTMQAVRVEIPIDFTREVVATGDPSRVVDARDGLGMVVNYRPQPPDGTVPVATAGRVFFLPSDSSLEVPIYATIKRNVNDPGAGGSLLSIAPAGILPSFASPGNLRLFNFTILNEGAKPDVAVTTAALAAPVGWTAEVFPSTPIALGPGERGNLQVGVRPRGDAQESEAALLDVVVTSEQDPTARASISARIVSTREGGITGDEAPPILAEANKSGLLPGPGAAFVLLGVGLLGLVLRRRL